MSQLVSPPPLTYGYFECRSTACQFRFPADIGNVRAKNCPVCGTRTEQASHETERPRPTTPVAPLPVVGVLDNVRSLLNVGTIFRSADGVGVEHLYLCGITATPEHRKLSKSALGTEATQAWSHHKNGLVLAQSLKQQGYQLWALEDGDRAVSAGDIQNLPLKQRIALVVGHERAGVDPAILALCDQHIFLPMHGIKRSLNVATAFTTVAYLVRFAMET